MKKIIALLVVLSIVVCGSLPAVFAEGGEQTATESRLLVSTQMIDTADGGYLLISLYQNTDSGAADPKASSYTRIGTKDVTKYDSSNNLDWKYTLTAPFNVNSGVSATCTNASYSYTINDAAWSFSNGSTSYQGNAAHGCGTFTYKILGFIVINTQDIDVSITCDVYGNCT